MLEHVSANQTRFVAPGLSADARGIAIGRFLAVLLPSVDRVVNFFSGLSERGSLDEFMVSLRIVQVKTPLRSRELLILVPVSGSHAADGVAAVARLVGGLVFTGSSKHFVRYRDARAPLGYDVDNLQGGSGDFVLYSADFVQSYATDRDLAFDRLVFGLALRRDRGEAAIPGEAMLIRVEQGLWRVLLAYIHRNGLRAGAATVEPEGGGDRVFMIRCETLPARMVALFAALPGVELFRSRSESLAVQLGYRHPIELSSCASVFRKGSLYLMSGDRGVVEYFAETPRFVPGEALVNLEHHEPPTQSKLRAGEAPPTVTLPLKLVPTSGRCPRLVATRIPIDEAWRFKKLVYLLPPSVLDTYGFCTGEDSIFLHAEEGIDYLPLGCLYWEIAPGVLVPQGFDLLPRVAPEVLVSHLGATSNIFVFLSRSRSGDDAPELLRVPRGSFAPVGRAVLAALPGRDVVAERPLGEPEVEGRIVNDEVEAFALWNYESE